MRCGNQEDLVAVVSKTEGAYTIQITNLRHARHAESLSQN